MYLDYKQTYSIYINLINIYFLCFSDVDSDGDGDSDDGGGDGVSGDY